MTKVVAMRDALLTQIHAKMATDETIFFVTADFGSPILDKIRQDFPKRFVNVGIAEQNLINVCAGLAIEGFTVFAYAIAPFITMRCFEQLRVNLALLSEVREMNVNLIGVGAGYSYVVSGPTHQCYEDLSLMRSLPNFQIFSPSDQDTSAGLISLCTDELGPKYIRLDAQMLPKLRSDIDKSTIENGFEKLLEGPDGVIIATGYMTHTALNVARELMPKFNLGVIDLINISGFNIDAFNEIISNVDLIFSLEEGFESRGGMDTMLQNHLKKFHPKARFHGLGVRPGYSFELGTREELHEQVGIGKNAALERIKMGLISKG